MLPALCECDGCFISGIPFIFLFSYTGIWEIDDHVTDLLPMQNILSEQRLSD
jgi:hypothetical protein